MSIGWEIDEEETAMSLWEIIILYSFGHLSTAVLISGRREQEKLGVKQTSVWDLSRYLSFHREREHNGNCSFSGYIKQEKKKLK
jgi:hypothetical protein